MEKQSPQKNNLPGLPNFSDKIPKLLEILEKTQGVLQKISEKESTYPHLEQLSEYLHGLKGLSCILPHSGEIAQELVEFYLVLDNFISGNCIWKCNKNLVSNLEQISEQIKRGISIKSSVEKLKENLQIDLDHGDRLKKIPQPIYKINERVSKKAYEAIRYQFSNWIMEEQMILEEFVLWNTRLQDLLKENEAQTGILIYSSPQLITGDGTKIDAIAWIGWPRLDNTQFLKKLECSFPNAKIRKIS